MHEFIMTVVFVVAPIFLFGFVVETLAARTAQRWANRNGIDTTREPRE